MDQALRQSGFLLIENHGVPASLRDRIRAEASRFFALPAEQKSRYATPVAGRGWIPQGGEANAFYGEVADPDRADMKESITNGRDFLTGDAAIDAGLVHPERLARRVPGARGAGRGVHRAGPRPVLRPAADERAWRSAWPRTSSSPTCAAGRTPSTSTGTRRWP